VEDTVAIELALAPPPPDEDVEDDGATGVFVEAVDSVEVSGICV
jgi:hypothetical protein